MNKLSLSGSFTQKKATASVGFKASGLVAPFPRVQQLVPKATQPKEGCKPAVVEVEAKYKLKTRKAAAKRFKRTGSGKIMHRHGSNSHLQYKKDSRRQKRLEIDAELDSTKVWHVERMCPYL